MGVLDHVWLGLEAVLFGEPLFEIFGIGASATICMVVLGFVIGIAVGSTPGLAGPMAMAISLPILISIFGVGRDALLPVLGFLVGVMKGATIGGAAPAILFNTPGTPDAFLTTLDGHPMAQRGQAGKALRVAHRASASGDTISDLVLFTCAPFLAILVEQTLDLPEKTALILLSLAFIGAVVGGSPMKGLISAALGLLVAMVGTGQDLFAARMTFGAPALSSGFPIEAVVLGVLILGELFKSLDDMRRAGPSAAKPTPESRGDASRLSWAEFRALMPTIGASAAIGSAIGALPGVGSTLAATLGYARAKRRSAGEPGPAFGEGAPKGVAATEAANSAVSGANLIPVLSLGIPGNTAAVFLILAAESIDGLTPGPAVFRISENGAVNPEMVMAFGLFWSMMLANIVNWSIGGGIMRGMSVLARARKSVLTPVVLLVTLTAIYVQNASMSAMWIAVGFGVLGYVFRRVGVSVLPFVIAFILGGDLEETARLAFAASGGDPWFLLTNPVAAAFLGLAVLVVVGFAREPRQRPR